MNGILRTVRQLAWWAMWGSVLLAAPPSHAAEYVLDSAHSSLDFTATQQGAEFQGEFQQFTATVRFDPDALRDCHIEATVELASVNTQNDERDRYLRGEDWFDVAKWPEATFVAGTFERVSGDQYQARGRLTLRGITHTVDMSFRFWKPTGTEKGHARLQGSVILHRLDFGVGQNMWQDTRWVGDEVVVHVDLSLDPARG